MRICVPTRDARGANSRLNEEFEHTPYFTIVDTKSGRLEVVPGDRHRGHAHRSHHVALMAAKEIDTVVCRRMAKRTWLALHRAGVEVCVADEDELLRIIERAWERRLEPLSPRTAKHGSEATSRIRREDHWRDRFHDLARGRESHGPGSGHRPRQSRRSS